MARLEGVSLFRHLRLFALLFSLALVDLLATAAIAYHLYTTKAASALILFGFEV
jgi:hypothetical protein